MFVHRCGASYESQNGNRTTRRTLRTSRHTRIHPLRQRLDKVGVNTAYIEPGSPWENGYIESFNARLRDELLNGEIFETLLEAKVLIERWRIHYNTVRPHSALGGRPPAPETIIPRKDFTKRKLDPILT